MGKLNIPKKLIFIYRYAIIQNMNTITIPKNLIKNDDLVIVPRKTYEGLLRASQKNTEKRLPKDLEEALQEVRDGKVIGPFYSVKDLKKSLER
jgi:RNase P protein component